MFATHMSTSDKQYPIAKMSDASEKPQANVHCPQQWPFAFLTNLAKEATRHETKNLVPTNDQAEDNWEAVARAHVLGTPVPEEE